MPLSLKKLNQVDKSYAPSDRLNPEIIKRIMWDHGITFSTEEVSVLLAKVPPKKRKEIDAILDKISNYIYNFAD